MSNAGSSPRVRGTRDDGGSHAYGRRFIPARAGNSRPTPCRPRCPSVHPRACGELDRIQALDATFYGSSPRVRGTQPMRWAVYCSHRFIPARAGNSMGGVG